MDCLAVTDHDTMRGVARVAPLIQTIPGEEITTDQGDLIGLFLQEEVKPGPLDRALDALRDQDAIVYVPHPFDPLRRRECVRTAFMKDFADVIEGFNGRCVMARFNERAMEYAHRHGIALGAGSDAHSVWEVGHGYVEMEDFQDRTSFLRSLRSGRLAGHRSTPLVHVYTKALKLLTQRPTKA